MNSLRTLVWLMTAAALTGAVAVEVALLHTLIAGGA